MSKLLPKNYLSNTTFDEQVVLDTLTEIKKRSASYVQEVQKDLVGYHKFDYHMSDFKADRDSKTLFSNTKRYVLNVPKQLLQTANKELYKKSNLFMKEISVADIAKNIKIFPLNFVVFIDGAIYSNFKIVIGEDISKIILYINNKNISDGFEEAEYRELLEKDAKVTVFFIPNSISGSYSTNKYVIKKFNNKVPIERFNVNGELTENSITYSTISSNGVGAHAVISCQTHVDKDICVNNTFDCHLTTSFVNIGFISFKYFDRVIDIAEGGDYFELPIRTHIVPTSSFIAFYEDDGDIKYYHDLDIKFHYPNIYKVSNNEVPLKLHVFYHVPQNEAPFINEMELYYRFFGKDVLYKYKNGTIPDVIKNYVPKEFPVSINMFKNSNFQLPIDYKTQTMHENIERESKNLSLYLKNMMKNRRKTRIRVKNLDLDAKLRTNVNQDIPGKDIEFNEERYVFIFSKHFVYDYELRFFIDGLFYFCDQKFFDEDFYYFYIPTSIVKQDSVIEIEKCRSLQYDFDVTFTENIVEINIDENPCIASDVMFIDTEGNFLDEDLFKFIIEENGKEIEIDATSHKQLPDKFKVRLIEDNLLNRPMIIVFRRLSAVYEYKVNCEEDRDKPLLFKTNISRHPGHLRIYRNGRLMPPDVYDIRFKSRYENYNVITLNRQKLIGDVYHIEFNPDINYVNYYTLEINTDGLLDFGGKLNKPFDLKWFDVFLNGFKLDESNFDILTPRYALIKGVKSKDHLLIMEKNWRDDIFKFRTTKEFPIPEDFVYNSCTDDELLDIEGTGIKEEIDKIKEEIIPDDTIPDLLPDLIEDISDPISQLMSSIIRNVLNVDRFINPDIDKYRYDLPKHIEDILKESNGILNIFPKVVPNLTTSVVINPDKGLIDPETVDEIDGVIIN